jgi:murein DD-endopeptidase MepM/ murein hydrolase activator NlpD
VLAANRGVVALVGDFYYSGRVVYLDHGRGLVTAYLHLSQVDVAAGDTVERGSLVGRVGATGRVTGPHLHWMVRYGRVSLDGLRLLELDLSSFGEPEYVADAGAAVASDGR